MALGKCVNISKPCSKALNREEIEADKANFICPECGKPLVEIQDKSKKKKGPGDPPPPPSTRLIAIIAAAVLVLAGVGFGAYKLIGGGPEIDKIKLEPKSLALVIGQKDVVKATVVDKDGNEIKDAKVTYKWTVKDEKIVSITQGGEVAALKKGKTAITVKIEGDDKHRATCQIEVKEKQDPDTTDTGGNEVLITSLSVDNTSISLKEGEQKELTVNVEPANFTEDLAAESNNPEVAVVENSVIIAKKAGSAQIVIKAEKSGKSASIAVTVTKKNTGTGEGTGGGGKEPKGRYHGTISIGNYGSYSGDILNGKPDGAGVLTYTRPHQAGRDFKTGEPVSAENGERVDGTWNNGFLSSGVIYKNDGNTIKIKH